MPGSVVWWVMDQPTTCVLSAERAQAVVNALLAVLVALLYTIARRVKQ